MGYTLQISPVKKRRIKREDNNIMSASRLYTKGVKKAEGDGCEMDYIIYEYYRRTGKIADDRVDGWIEAFRYVMGLGKPANKMETLRVPRRIKVA